MDQRILGILVRALLGVLVVVKWIATGSVLGRPNGNLLLWFVNAFNLFFLLVANPFAAILLITRQMDVADPTFLAIGEGWLRSMLEIAGLVISLKGFFLMGGIDCLGCELSAGGNGVTCL